MWTEYWMIAMYGVIAIPFFTYGVFVGRVNSESWMACIIASGIYGALWPIVIADWSIDRIAGNRGR